MIKVSGKTVIKVGLSGKPMIKVVGKPVIKIGGNPVTKVTP